MNYTFLQGKSVMITGASRGIGRQIALALANKGCLLYLHSRNLDNTKDLAQELQAKGTQVQAYAADLADPAQAEALARQIEKDSGGVDILFNNAAIMTAYHHDFIAPVKEYLDSYLVNVVSLIKICDVILPVMKERGFGRIVNTSSGIQDQPELTAYAITKAAVDKYVKDMACKLAGTDVLMNLLDPVWLQTDLGGQYAPNKVEDVIPGALVPALLPASAGSGKLYRALDYKGRALV